MVHIYYSYRMYYYCDCLPFSHLDDREFQSVSGCWSIDPSKLKTSPFDLITNPDKFDECDPDHKYNRMTKPYTSWACLHGGTIFHCNIRSLPKNLILLHDILYCLDSRPNIIAISETRLKLMRTQFQTLNYLITISFTMTRLLQQVEQDLMSQKNENQSQGLIFS